MCGHAILALIKLALETSLARKGDRPDVVINVPAGTVHGHAVMNPDKVLEESFRNVPSFVYLRDQGVDVPGLGHVRCDVVYGGAFYAVVEAAPLGLGLTAEYYTRLIDRDMQLNHNWRVGPTPKYSWKMLRRILR